MVLKNQNHQNNLNTNSSDFIDLHYPILPAPMCGIMDYPFRYIVSHLGSPVVYSEMIASYAVVDKSRRDYIDKMSCVKDIDSKTKKAIQISGRDPLIISEAAKFFEQIGFDFIDINFGCPVKKVVNRMAGSALMKDEDLACRIVESVVNAVKCPVTVKMRMGWDEGNLNAGNLINKFQNIGIKMVTVHCRTRSQMYKGSARWSFIKELKEQINIKIPIIVNGDIKSFDDIKASLDESTANGVMIGRHMYGRPWAISSYIKKLFPSSDYIDYEDYSESMLLDFVAMHMGKIIDFYDEKLAVNFAKKHLMFYIKSIFSSEGKVDAKNDVASISTKNDIDRFVNNYC